MFRLAGIISLSFLILLSGFGGGIYSIVYELAQNTLTEQYCVNKVDDCCRAKCHMSKVVKNESESPQTAKHITWKPVEFIPAAFPETLSPQASLYNGSLAFYRTEEGLLLSHTIWHPPCTIA